MRAAASSVCARARSWQSQRVTRRSLSLSLLLSLLLSSLSLALARDGSVFQPVPWHSGQTSDWVLANFNPDSWMLLKSAFLISISQLYQLTVHPDASFPQVRNHRRLCTTCEGAAGAVEGGGKPLPACILPERVDWLPFFHRSPQPGTRSLSPDPGHGGAKQASGADFHS